jgi:hypothetical protein
LFECKHIYNMSGCTILVFFNGGVIIKKIWWMLLLLFECEDNYTTT